MDFITIFFIAMVLGTIVLAPRFGAESRRTSSGSIWGRAPAGRPRGRGTRARSAAPNPYSSAPSSLRTRRKIASDDA